MSRTRPRWPVRMALAVVAVALLVTTGGLATAGAQNGEGTPLTLRLVRQTAWVGPEGQFRVQIRAESLPAGAVIRLVFYPNVISSHDGLEAAAAGEPRGKLIYQTSASVAESTMPDGTIAIAADTSRADFQSTGGLYPVEVQVSAPGESQPRGRLVTTMIRLATPTSAGTSPLAIGVVVPLQAPATPGPDGAPALDDVAADDLTTLLSTVTAPSQVPLTVAPSPESLLLLSDRDDAGREAVAALQRATAQILDGPFAPIDTGAWMDSGLVAQMDHQYEQGAATLAELIDRPTSPLAVLDRTVTGDALGHLQDLGTTSVVSPSGQLSGGSGSAATLAQQVRLATGDDRSVASVVASDAAGNRLRPGGDPVLGAHQALAELAFLDQAQSGATDRGVAVIVPSDVDSSALTTFLAALADPTGSGSGAAGAPAVAPTTLDQLFTTTAPQGDRATERTYESDPPADLGTYPDELRDTAESYAGLVSLTPDALDLHVPIDRTLLSSGASDLDDDQRTAMVDGAAASIQATTGEIVVTPEQVVTLTSSSGNVPLNLENRLPYRAEVRIHMASDKLDFPQGSVIEQTLEPAQTTLINLPVETRASGAFPLTVDISSADSALPVATTRYTVRSTAISGIGLVLSIGAGLFLLVWWARHFRTSRRARKLVASTHPAVSGGQPAGYAPPDSDPLEGR